MRAAIFVTHPVQYHAPLWRALARHPGLEIVVHYFSDQSVRGGRDVEFGVDIAWDTPLLEGYESVFLSRDCVLNDYNAVAVEDAPGLLRKGRFDAVFLVGYRHRFARQVVRAARAGGLRTVLFADFADTTPFTGRGRLKALVRSAYLKWFYRQVDAFCCVGQDARDHLRGRGIPESRLFDTPYSVDTAEFERQRALFPRQQSRAELGITENQFVVTFSGKFIPRKDPLLLLEALRLAALDDAVALFLGDGPMRAEVEATARDVLGDRVRLVGFVNQSQLGRYYAASDVFVLPAHFDTWGLVVNEAMQFSLPVVVSSGVGCRRDLVIEGETGFTFRAGDAEALCEKLVTLHNDRERRAKMGRAARKLIEGHRTEDEARGMIEALTGHRTPVQAPV